MNLLSLCTARATGFSSILQQKGLDIGELIFFKLPGCFVDQRPVYADSYSGSLTSSKKKDCFLSEHFDLCSSAILMQLPKSHQQSEPRPSAEEGEACRRPHERLPPSSSFMGGWKLPLFLRSFPFSALVSRLLLTSFCCPGTFGKAPWRPPNDLHTGFGLPNRINPEENPYAAPDAELDPDESGSAGDSVYERPFDGGRTEPTSQLPTST